MGLSALHQSLYVQLQCLPLIKSLTIKRYFISIWIEVLKTFIILWKEHIYTIITIYFKWFQDGIHNHKSWYKIFQSNSMSHSFIIYHKLCLHSRRYHNSLFYTFLINNPSSYHKSIIKIDFISSTQPTKSES